MSFQRSAVSFQLCVAVLLISACMQTRSQPSVNDLPDVGFFDEADCQTACWQGIYPGTTSLAELDNHPLLGVSNHLRLGNYLQYHIESEGEIVYFVNIHFASPQVQRIELFRQNDWFALNLAEIMSILGEPEFVLYRYVHVSYGDAMIYELRLTLYYPQSGYSFVLYESRVQDTAGLSFQSGSDAMNVCIEDNAAVSSINVFEARSITDVVDDYEMVSGVITSWSGFGCHDVMYTELE